MYTDGDTICAFGTIIAIVGFAGIFAVDADKVDAVMRPSATLNAALAAV